MGPFSSVSAVANPRKFARELVKTPGKIPEVYGRLDPIARKALRGHLAEELAELLYSEPHRQDVHAAVRFLLREERDPQLADALVDPVARKLAEYPHPELVETARLLVSRNPNAAHRIASRVGGRLHTNFDRRVADALLELGLLELRQHGSTHALDHLATVLEHHASSGTYSPDVESFAQHFLETVRDLSPYVDFERGPADVAINRGKDLFERVHRAFSTSPIPEYRRAVEK